MGNSIVDKTEMRISGFSKVEFILHESVKMRGLVDDKIDLLKVLVFSLEHIREHYSDSEMLDFINVLNGAIVELEMFFESYNLWIKEKAIPMPISEIENIMRGKN